MLAKLPSTLIGGIAGIGSALIGLGVWSLIVQQITDITAYSIQVWIQADWRPKWIFDWRRVEKLFDYGNKMMLSSIIQTAFSHIYEIVIGRYFSTTQVGLYTQANKIKQLPVKNISNTLSRVSFPILSSIQDDNARLKKGYKKIIRLIVFLISPIMIGALVISKPMFSLVLTDKWLPAVPYFQWLCISGLFFPINAYNLNIIKVKGRSDLVLYLNLLKKAIMAICVFLLINLSVYALVVFRAVFSIFAYFINSYFSGKFINYGLFEQIKDISIIIIIASIMGILLEIFNLITVSLSDSLVLVLNIIIGGGTYLMLIYFFENEVLEETLTLLKKLNKDYI